MNNQESNGSIVLKSIVSFVLLVCAGWSFMQYLDAHQLYATKQETLATAKATYAKYKKMPYKRQVTATVYQEAYNQTKKLVDLEQEFNKYDYNDGQYQSTLKKISKMVSATGVETDAKAIDLTVQPLLFKDSGWTATITNGFKTSQGMVAMEITYKKDDKVMAYVTVIYNPQSQKLVNATRYATKDGANAWVKYQVSEGNGKGVE